MKILVAYASRHGSTREVAEFISRTLRIYNLDVTTAEVETVNDIGEYDACVMGSPIHGGMWLHEMCEFTDRFHDQLAAKRSYFWINCLRAVEPDGYEYALEYYVDHKTLESFNVRNIAVFPGKLNFEGIDWNERWVLASNYSGKLLPGSMTQDFRNWEAIASWANGVAKDLQVEPDFKTQAALENARESSDNRTAGQL